MVMMTLTPAQVRSHYSAAIREKYALNPHCECCDRGGIAQFGAAYRHWRKENGQPDPGNLCPICAAIAERMWAD